MVRLDDNGAEPPPRVSRRGGLLPFQRAAAPARNLSVIPDLETRPEIQLIGPLPTAGRSAARPSAETLDENAGFGSDTVGRLRRARIVVMTMLRQPIPSLPGSPLPVLALSACIFAMVAWSVPHALPWVTAALFVLVGLSMMQPLFLLLDALGVGTVVIIVLTLAGQPVWNGLSIGLVLLGTIVLGLALHRDRDEVIGAIGGAAAADAMLIDLRERIQRRRQPPLLPAQWMFETDLRAARGDGFCGDFVVSATEPGRRLDVGLVDVSGKGSAAGARAVLLSGALEALLNAVAPQRFLAAANEHVLRMGDDDGFATAVHASIDLVSGEFTVRGAGHPPAVHYRAGSGRWDVLDVSDQGPALGLMHGATYSAQQGVLARGDMLLLFTDGLVENRLLDVTRGIDRLVGHAEAVVARGGVELASEIAEAIRAEDGDDRALMLIRHI